MPNFCENMVSINGTQQCGIGLPEIPRNSNG